MISEEWTSDNIIRLLRSFSGFGDKPDSDQLWWRTDAEYAPVTFLINCNDLFAWAYADCEDIFPSDLAALESAISDLKDGSDGHLLWVARKRRLRPQVAYYKYFKDDDHKLFDACGPAETQYGRQPNRSDK